MSASVRQEEFMRLHVRGSLAIITAGLLLAGCGGGGGDSTPTSPPGGGSGNTQNPPPSTSVKVGNNSFTPTDLTVPAGSTVTWTWDSCTGGDGYGNGQTCYDHSVTFTSGTSSETKSSGTFSRAFPTAGTYNYQCIVHGAAMSGRIIVQ
jgi:plastocyanin